LGGLLRKRLSFSAPQVGSGEAGRPVACGYASQPTGPQTTCRPFLMSRNRRRPSPPAAGSPAATGEITSGRVQRAARLRRGRTGVGAEDPGGPIGRASSLIVPAEEETRTPAGPRGPSFLPSSKSGSPERPARMRRYAPNPKNSPPYPYRLKGAASVESKVHSDQDSFSFYAGALSAHVAGVVLAPRS